MANWRFTNMCLPLLSAGRSCLGRLYWIPEQCPTSHHSRCPGCSDSKSEPEPAMPTGSISIGPNIPTKLGHKPIQLLFITQKPISFQPTLDPLPLEVISILQGLPSAENPQRSRCLQTWHSKTPAPSPHPPGASARQDGRTSE